MLEFVHTQKGLEKLEIISDCRNNSMKYDDEFRKLFGELVKERGHLEIRVQFGQGEREMKISAKGFSEMQEYETPRTDKE